MYSDSCDSSSPATRFEVLLDGRPVELPPQRRTLLGIRSYLEAIALGQHRLLWAFSIDGDAAASAGTLAAPGQFLRVIGQTMGLEQIPLQLVENAIHQTTHTHAEVLRAVSQVLINDPARGHELWWDLTGKLKQPVLTLSLLPETICGASGGASLMQLRRWQLQQLAAIINEVDQTCQAEDPTALSDALEKRVLPWLESLQESLDLLRHTLLIAHEPAGRDL